MAIALITVASAPFSHPQQDCRSKAVSRCPPASAQRSCDCPASRHRVFGVLAHVGGPEAEDDVGLWDTGLDESWSDAVLGVVGLDPQLAVDDVDVRERVMNALVVVPAESDE